MEDSEQLIQDCARKNRVAQEKLYRRFYPALFLLCKRLLANDQEALECLNDGMLKVYFKISHYKKEKGDFFNWMYTIICNTALDRLKVNRVVFTEVKGEEYIPSQDNLFEIIDSKDIYKLLDVLPPATRVVCTLFYMEGFSIKQVSKELNLSDGTIKWHLSEGRKKLKSVFKNHYS